MAHSPFGLRLWHATLLVSPVRQLLQRVFEKGIFVSAQILQQGVANAVPENVYIGYGLLAGLIRVPTIYPCVGHDAMALAPLILLLRLDRHVHMFRPHHRHDGRATR